MAQRIYVTFQVGDWLDPRISEEAAVGLGGRRAQLDGAGQAKVIRRRRQPDVDADALLSGAPHQALQAHGHIAQLRRRDEEHGPLHAWLRGGFSDQIEGARQHLQVGGGVLGGWLVGAQGIQDIRRIVGMEHFQPVSGQQAQIVRPLGSLVPIPA